jgi:SAM-dependent methyltransferase
MSTMREIICPICGGREKTPVFDATLPPDFDERAPPSPYSAHYCINRCSDCGLIHSSPVMNEQGVTALYEHSRETNVLPGEEDNVRRTMSLYYRLAAPHVLARQRVLDIGCDMGFLLEAAAADGFAEMHGIEPNPVARQVAERVASAHIGAQFFEQTKYPADHFDLISMVHVLDHLFDPSVVLNQALANLRPGGIVLAVVHNVGSPLAKLLGERFAIFNLYHHYFFDEHTLAELFRRHGFEVIKVSPTYNCYSLGFFVRRAPGVPEAIRNAVLRVLEFGQVISLPLTIPVGNIGIVARRPIVP